MQLCPSIHYFACNILHYPLKRPVKVFYNKEKPWIYFLFFLLFARKELVSCWVHSAFLLLICNLTYEEQRALSCVFWNTFWVILEGQATGLIVHGCCKAGITLSLSHCLFQLPNPVPFLVMAQMLSGLIQSINPTENYQLSFVGLIVCQVLPWTVSWRSLMGTRTDGKYAQQEWRGLEQALRVATVSSRCHVWLHPEAVV